MIEVHRVTKRFGEYLAVDIGSLKVPHGSVFGFIGPNGAGKTTKIKMMVGLLQPNTGDITIDNNHITHQSLEAKRRFAYLPDKPQVYEKLTGREFVQFMANLYHKPYTNDQLNKKMQDYFEIFKLTDKADEYIQSYSHGMRQKIAIVGALIHDPPLMILDEPLIGLDPPSSKLLKDILVDRAKSGHTVLLTTHILEVAEKICDMIAVINQGRIVFQGSTRELQASKGNKSLEDIFLAMIDDDAVPDEA